MIRYGHQLNRFPNDCVCGSQFNLEHSLSCKKGGFVTLCHNIVRDLTADLLSEVCKDVRIEPPLNQLTGETLDKASNTSNEARLDIAARRFWISRQKAFFLYKRFDNAQKSHTLK